MFQLESILGIESKQLTIIAIIVVLLFYFIFIPVLRLHGILMLVVKMSAQDG